MSAPPIIPAIAIAPDSSRIVSVSLVISLTSLPITSRDSLLTEKPTEMASLEFPYQTHEEVFPVQA